MPRYEVTGPNGGRYEVTAPEGASEQDAIRYIQSQGGTGQQQPQALDFDAPIADLRAAIGALPKPQHKKAYDTWADKRVAKERAAGLLTPPQVARGIPFVGPLLDEATAGIQSGLYSLTGGVLGEPYDEALAMDRARQRSAYEAHPIAAPLSEFAGAAVTPLPLFAKGAGLLKNIAKSTAIGGAIGAGAGFGAGEGGLENRLGSAETGGVIGSLFGLGIPLGVAGGAYVGTKVRDALSPFMARTGANVKAGLEAFRKKYGILADSSGATAPPNPGADAAAAQTIANQLSRANMTVDDLRTALNEAERASLYSGGGARGNRGASYAENPLAIVDLDPSLQRLAGSMVRQSPEAGNAAKAFVYGRQTGRTPQSGPLPEETGIATRPRLARPQPGDKPMGQYERVKDALKRSLLIRDEDFHGHASNAYRTEEAIVAGARVEAKQLYDDAYDAGRNLNIRPVIEPILEKWRDIAAQEPPAVARKITFAINQFTSKQGPVHNIERFDKAKQFLDGEIDKLFKSNEGRNHYVGGVVTELKNELLAAVDQIPAQDLGTKYQAARAAFSSKMEMRDALRLGRDVFREESDVAVDHFAALTSPGQQKLFRLGLLDSFERHMGQQKRTADVGQIFENPRIEQILGAVIPRTETATGRVRAGATFADRPERFGRYLESEGRTVQTRNEVFGNSKTAERLADDEAYEGLAAIVDKARGSPSMLAFATNMMGDTLNKLFGYRADTAASMARMLFTANPAAREKALEAIAKRLGRDRFGMFTRLLKEHNDAITRAAAGQGGQAGAGL